MLLRTAITNPLYEIVTLTNSFLKDPSAKKVVKEPRNIPHVIRLLILAENFAGKKRLTFYLSQVNEHVYNRKRNLMMVRVIKTYLIKTKNMFKFDLKHGYYHINKLVPRIFVENWKSWIFCSYSFCPSDLIKPRFCLERLFIL